MGMLTEGMMHHDRVIEAVGKAGLSSFEEVRVLIALRNACSEGWNPDPERFEKRIQEIRKKHPIR